MSNKKSKEKQDINLEDVDFIDLEADVCKASFYYFVQTFWDVIIPETPVWNWHIEYLCDELQSVTPNIKNRKPKKHDILINIPPGSTKSTIVTIMWPAWLWAVDPSLRIISNSYSGDISTEHATKSRDIIYSEKYKLYFPDVEIRKDKSGKQSYDTTKNGARYTTSTGGTITGKHAHVIINDDPQNPQQAQSEPHRKQAINHTKTLSSRKVDKESTVTVTVMQRLHSEDVSGYLLEKEREDLHYIKLPAELTAKSRAMPSKYEENYIDGILDPKRLGVRAIKEAKVDLGSRGYSGQWLQNPTAEGGDIIKEDWFGSINRNEFLRLVAENGGDDIENHFFIDTAYTDNTENDPSGILAACTINNHIYIYARKKFYKNFPDLMKAIPVFVTANGYNGKSTVRIEPKASGKSVVQALSDRTQLNVVETPTPKDSKMTRLWSVSAIVESGRVILVDSPWNDDFITEVCGFPNMPHDEDVDLLVYAIDYLLGSGNKTYITTESLSEMGIAY